MQRETRHHRPTRTVDAMSRGRKATRGHRRVSTTGERTGLRHTAIEAARHEVAEQVGRELPT